MSTEKVNQYNTLKWQVEKTLVRVATGVKEEDVAIPLCFIFPKFTATENHHPRYNVTACFRTYTPGSASLRTRILGMLLCSSGYGDDQEKDLWMRWKKTDDINAEAITKAYTDTLTDKQWSELNKRYGELENAYEIFWNNVDNIDTGELEDRMPYYNFGFYERWTRKPDQSVERTWVWLGNKAKLYHDIQRPMYNMIRYIVLYGLTATGLTQYRIDIKRMMQDTGDTRLLDDPGLLMYERLFNT